MKVGDLVDHRNGGPRSVLGIGLITGLDPAPRGDHRVEVLWSNTGEILVAHHASELQVLHESR